MRRRRGRRARVPARPVDVVLTTSRASPSAAPASSASSGTVVDAHGAAGRRAAGGQASARAGVRFAITWRRSRPSQGRADRARAAAGADQDDVGAGERDAALERAQETARVGVVAGEPPARRTTIVFTAPIRRASRRDLVEQGQGDLLQRDGEVQAAHRRAGAPRRAPAAARPGHPEAQIEVGQLAARRTPHCASPATASDRRDRPARRTAAAPVGPARCRHLPPTQPFRTRACAGRQPRDRHAERRARHVVEPELVAEPRPTPDRRRARRRCRA